MSTRSTFSNLFLALALVLCGACREEAVQHIGRCDSDNAGLQLPRGFCARVYADTVGLARHIAVAANGDVYVAMEDESWSSAGSSKLRGARGALIVLRDTTGDGRADVMTRLVEKSGSGVALQGDALYFSTPTSVYRYRIDPARADMVFDERVVVTGMPSGGHSSRSLALGDSGRLFVNIGSDSNVCQRADPCPELSERAAIWRFDVSRIEQTLDQGTRYASGIRNAVGIAWNDRLHALFATQQGRDALGAFKQYSTHDNDILPSEEFMRVAEGDDFGWPYCYHDWRTNQRVLAPEYGGDGTKAGRCSGAQLPLMGFPGHWAPDGLLFYEGKLFPEHYQRGAFIAFHGSWNRRRQEGYNVVFVPFRDDKPEGDYEVFADGFAGRHVSPSGARHRPVGMAVAPDGSLYITDDQRGRIYNIWFNDITNDSTGRR